MKKNIFNSLLAVTLCGMIVLTGCGNPKSEENTTVQDAEQNTESDDAGEETGRTGKGITIRMLTRASGSDSSVILWDKCKKEFQEKYPDITLQDESINDGTAFDNQFKADIASGNVADVIEWPGLSVMKPYAESGVFLDMTEVINNDEDIKNNVDSSLIDMMNLSGVGVEGIYALPKTISMEVFYYNKDLFKKAGIEKLPETWDEFYEVCEKLEQINVIPWSLGTKNPWRATHLLNAIIYRLSGASKGAQLGSGEAKWTDEDIVEAFAFIQNLAERGIFGDDYQGIDYETEKQRFMSGETAITLDGNWRIAELKDMEESVGTFRVPCFEGKEEFARHDVAYPTQFELGGHLKDDSEKLSYVSEFLFLYVSKELQEMALYETSQIPVRTDIEIDSSGISPILAEILEYKNADNVVFGSDIWSYDTNASAENFLGDAMTGALNGMTAEEAAKQMQDSLDAAR